MKKVLFVCLGNICRSPLAEALFRKHTKALALDNEFDCDSCGTAAYHIGAPPDERSVANAAENGLHYTNRGRKLTQQDVSNFNYIIAMDEENLRNIKKVAPAHHPHIYKMRMFDTQNKNADVPDPYYGGDQGFQEVFEILDRATLHLLRKISTSI